MHPPMRLDAKITEINGHSFFMSTTALGSARP
jgi:hypothetical protein